MNKLYTHLILFLASVTISNAQPGVLDYSFGTDGIAITQVSTTYNFGMATVVQPDGKIIVVGYAGTPSTYNAAVVRYNTDGTLDISFGDAGKLTIPVGTAKSYASDVALQDDGKILIGARTWNNVSGDFALVRLNEDGTFDNSFGTNGIVIASTGGSDVSASLLIADDGKILLAGDSDSNFSVAKFNTDGTLDTSFGTNGWSITIFDNPLSFIQEIAFQNDGKIVMGGFAVNELGRYQMAAARLNTDGTLDNSFGTGGKVSFNFGVDHDFATALAIQSDGKIVLGGHTYITNSPMLKYDFAVVRLNTNGDLDTTYGDNGVATAQIVDAANYTNAMVIQADDKIVLAGHTVSAVLEYNMAMLRFDTNGELDTTFGNNGKVSTDVDGREDYAYAIALQPDNKIIVAGYSYPAGADDSAIVVARYDNDLLSVGDNQSLDFRVYPNPASNQLTVEMSDASSTYQIEVFDILGKKVISSEIQKVGTIDVSALAQGTYVLKLNSDNKTNVVRFVKN